MALKIYNSLSRNIEEFKPENPQKVTMYTCGPTVYDLVHIGNYRTYILSDVLYRTLEFLGYDVEYVMNITDVGHLVSDADEGEDKMTKGASREGLTMWELAAKYTNIFLEDSEKLHLISPHVLARATDHIDEQIRLVSVLEEKGYTYETSDGIYFDTSKLPSYGELSVMDHEHIEEGARVTANPEKRNPTDFALWKFYQGDGKREMEWESPWGVGFPGWHIECSAMSLKYLADAYENGKILPERTQTIDFHLGGEDLRMTHHPNEIAQSEAATKKKFVNYWIHGAFLLINNQKLSKSKKNIVSVSEIEEKGINPIAYRYLVFSTHYRKQANFTWEALTAADNSLKKLTAIIASLMVDPGTPDTEMMKKFTEVLTDDLNMPESLAILWEIAKSELNKPSKLATLFAVDEIFGFGLKDEWVQYQHIPVEIREQVTNRETLRSEKKFAEADALRETLRTQGYEVEDTSEGPIIKIGK